MKRLTALLLSLLLVFSLCACAIKTGSTDDLPDFTEPPVVTLDDGSVVYSKEPFVEFPQTGEYKETALLTNVPGQGVPLLLDMCSDGTIDYIFADVDEKADFKNFSSSGAAYYTIAPDGTATKQNTEWMEVLDRYMATTLETPQDPNGKWRLLFTADEGTILILAQYHNVVQTPKHQTYPYAEGEFLYSTLLKVAGGQVNIIPLEWEIDVGTKTIDLRSQYLSSLELEDGQITISKRGDMYLDYENYCEATFSMDGTVISAQQIKYVPGIAETNIQMDDTGIFIESMDHCMEINTPEWTFGYHLTKLNTDLGLKTDSNGNPVSYFIEPEDISYTEDDSLYYLGKAKLLSSMKAMTQSGGKDFCCWFNEAGKGVLMRYTYNPAGKIEPEIVTVWSLESIDLVKAAVAEWNHTHASPIFRYGTAAEELKGTNLTEDDILTRLNLELLNNQGPDVMILDGLNVEKYIEFMTPLDRISTEGIYDSVLTRFTVSEDLLAIPARVSPYLLGREADGTEDITSLAQFADLVENNTDILGTDEVGRPITNIHKHHYAVDNYVQLFKLWYPAWADAIWADGQLNKDVFREFLTHTCRLSKLYGLNSYGGLQSTTLSIQDYLGYEENDQNGNLEFFPYLLDTDGRIRIQHNEKHPYTLAAPDHVGLYSFWRYAGEIAANKKSEPHYLSAIPGPDGIGAMVPVVMAGVRAGGNEDVGQEFVQILLSRELQLGGGYHYPILADGYPVVWDYTAELLQRMEAYMYQNYAVQNDYSEVLNSMRTVIIDETLYKMALYAAQCCYHFAPEESIVNRGITWEVLTVDEAVELLYELSRIYLAEKR